MNERIRELAEQANIKYSIRDDVFYSAAFDGIYGPDMERFVGECANYAFSDDQERNAMLEYFGVEEPKEFSWVCEKCGADRTKEPCQLAVEGKTVYGNCPIVRVAQ